MQGVKCEHYWSQKLEQWELEWFGGCWRTWSRERLCRVSLGWEVALGIPRGSAGLVVWGLQPLVCPPDWERAPLALSVGLGYWDFTGTFLLGRAQLQRALVLLEKSTESSFVHLFTITEYPTWVFCGSGMPGMVAQGLHGRDHPCWDSSANPGLTLIFSVRIPSVSLCVGLGWIFERFCC